MRQVWFAVKGIEQGAILTVELFEAATAYTSVASMADAAVPESLPLIIEVLPVCQMSNLYRIRAAAGISLGTAAEQLATRCVVAPGGLVSGGARPTRASHHRRRHREEVRLRRRPA
jgi:hypothetical protein